MTVEYNEVASILELENNQDLTRVEVERLIKDAERIIAEHLHNRRTGYFSPSVEELQKIKLATIEQVRYMAASGGDIGNMSGYIASERIFLDADEIQRRIVSPRAVEILKSTRYYFRGIL